jgi:hypothetical protein
MKTRPLLSLAALLLLPSCGHKGDPLPPLRRTPPAPVDFRFSQRGDVLEFEATAPAASIDGVAYDDRLSLEFLYGTGEVDLEKRGQTRLATGLPGQRVLATLPLPAPGTLVRAAARGAWSGQRGARTLTKAVPVQPPLEAPRELQASTEEEGVRLSWQGVRPKAVEPPPVGPRLPVAPLGPGSPAAGSARPPSAGGAPDAKPPAPAAPGGAAATTATPPAETAPPSPAGGPSRAPAAGTTVAGATAAGVAGEKPGGAAPEPVAPAARRNGFFVYRRLGHSTYGEPLGGEPLERRNAVDDGAPLGTRVCYVVRAVASTDPLIESGPSNEACVERRDQTAPAPPAGLAILPRGGGLEVLWSPSAEGDLGGYRVYREAPGEARRRLAEVAADKAAFLDEAAAKGVVYRYTVTAFDQSGNESEPTDPVEGSLP